MIKEFIERNNGEYLVKGTEYISAKTYGFTLYNPEKNDAIYVTGVRLDKLHKKCKELLKGTPLEYETSNMYTNYYAIDGEVYSFTGGQLHQTQIDKYPVLIQELKTKSKVIAAGDVVSNFVRLLVINGNMKGTGEHPISKSAHIRPMYIGNKIFKLSSGKLFTTTIQDNSITYDMPRDELKKFMVNNYVKIDENYHTVIVLPKKFDIDAYNKALLSEFGTRNGKPIFHIEEREYKGDYLC